MSTLFISHSSKDNHWAEALREVLREKGWQSLFLDFHPEDGIHAGAKWEQTLYMYLRKCRGVVVLCSRHWLTSPWCVAEAMLAREKGKPVFLIAAADVPGGRQDHADQDVREGPKIPEFLKSTQFISLAELTPKEAYERLWMGFEGEGLKDDFPLPQRPYPGLEPFTEADAAVFFGRDGEIARIKDTLSRVKCNNARGFIVVLGASGCGKSSLVRAGVLPRLKGTSKKSISQHEWVIAPPFNGGEGLDGLAMSLAHAFTEAGILVDFTSIRDAIEPARGIGGGSEDASHPLSILVRDLMLVRGAQMAHVLIVVDQLEEVIGLEESSDARKLLGLLLSETRRPGSPIVVLATMRSEFLNAFQLFPGASESYEEVTLDPMPKERFGEVIEGPAARFGITIQPGLTERLVEETAYNDALPLLAFTLEKLYAECGPTGPLTIKAYEASFPPVVACEEEGGRTEYRGVAAAIKHVADEILNETRYVGLPVNSYRMRDLRRAFYRLAKVGEEGQFTRRMALWSNMPRSCADVLERFVQQRLLVSKSVNKERILSVSHEALFRVWDTLRDWLIKDRKALRLRTQIEEAASEWDRERRAESRQWSDERIMDAIREITESGVSIDDVENPDLVHSFLGPTGRNELEALLPISETLKEDSGLRRYGQAWHVPLGHEARASVGVRLAMLGDPVRGDGRKGTGLLANGTPDIDWCPIKGGEVTIEILMQASDPYSEVAETLTRSLDSFWIARYTITVAQFQAFVHNCYKNGEWLLPSGFPMAFPEDYSVPKHRTRYPNHPADSVNWYDAAAFCYWLSEQVGFEVRLPTEFEWQLAATSGDLRRTYPWGREWDPDQEPWRANTYESGLGRATAVGLYPHGASPAGVFDMAGNVWEWCLNAFDDPYNVNFPATEDDHRAVRGGSWSRYQISARAAYRSLNLPSVRDVYRGFRCVCASPFQGPLNTAK